MGTHAIAALGSPQTCRELTKLESVLAKRAQTLKTAAPKPRSFEPLNADRAIGIHNPA